MKERKPEPNGRLVRVKRPLHTATLTTSDLARIREPPLHRSEERIYRRIKDVGAPSELREETSELRKEMRGGFAHLDRKFGQLDGEVKAFRQEMEK